MKLIKQMISVFLCLLLLLSLLVGCASQSKNSVGFPEDEALLEEGQYDSAQNTSASYTAGGTSSPLQKDKKIIKNAQLELRAKDVGVCYQQLLDQAVSLGGYEFSQTMSEFEGGKNVTAVLKLPPEQLDAFIRFAGESFKLTHSSVSSDDISQQYYDSQTRLETMKKSLDQYYVLLEKAEDTTSMLEIQKQIDSLILEMEALEGSLAYWDQLVAESTVEISIYTESTLADSETEWKVLSGSEMGKMIKNGFLKLCNVVVTVLQFLCIILICSAPIWIPVLILVLVLTRKRRKNKKSKSEITQQPETRD